MKDMFDALGINPNTWQWVTREEVFEKIDRHPMYSFQEFCSKNEELIKELYVINNLPIPMDLDIEYTKFGDDAILAKIFSFMAELYEHWVMQDKVFVEHVNDTSCSDLAVNVARDQGTVMRLISKTYDHLSNGTEQMKQILSVSEKNLNMYEYQAKQIKNMTIVIIILSVAVYSLQFLK